MSYRLLYLHLIKWVAMLMLGKMCQCLSSHILHHVRLGCQLRDDLVNVGSHTWKTGCLKTEFETEIHGRDFPDKVPPRFSLWQPHQWREWHMLPILAKNYIKCLTLSWRLQHTRIKGGLEQNAIHLFFLSPKMTFAHRNMSQQSDLQMNPLFTFNWSISN